MEKEKGLLIVKEEETEESTVELTVEEIKRRDLKLNLTVSRATYLENALRCAYPPQGAPLDLTRKLRDVEEAWKDAAHLCQQYLKDIK